MNIYITQEFRYIQPAIQVGKPLIISKDVLNYMGFPLTNFINLTKHTSDSLEDDEFIFFTGADENYSRRLTNLINNIQKFFPKNKIIVYDMGMKSTTFDKITQYCGVKEVRKFPFSRYPEHVRYLKNYAFKPIIIHEALR